MSAPSSFVVYGILFIFLFFFAIQYQSPKNKLIRAQWPNIAYQPTASGSGGMDPTRGIGYERETPSPSLFNFGEIGWWNGDIGWPLRSINTIYDNHAGIPDKTITEVGWWGTFF